MGWALPVGPGFEAVGVAEGDVDAGKLLVLEEVSDDPRQADVGADREFTHPVRVGVLPHVGLEVGPELRVIGLEGDQPVVLHAHQDWLGQQPVLGGEPVADLLRGDHAVDGQRRGEGLPLGQVAPAVLLPVAAVARDPFPVLSEGRHQVGSRARRDLDLGRRLGDVPNLLGDAVDLLVIGRHPVRHQFGCNPDHVAVAAAKLLRKQVQQRLPEGELALLAAPDVVRGGGSEFEDALADPAGKLPSGALDEILHGPGLNLGAGLPRLLLDRLGDG